ncbi:MAG: tetratricopeptide repeat protein [Acidobacteria bacterium]|nr:tetratricopeptide repeat protein [Acidobacteriota bacterium]
MKGGGLLLNRTRQVPAEDTAAFAGIAERFRRAGDLDRAITLCRDGLKKFPTLLSARVTLGWALLDKGCYDEARAELEQVLRRAPDNLAAIRGLAELHDRSEHIAQAADASWHQVPAAEDDPPAIAAADPDLPISSIFATAASLDEPIRLADFDVSAPADAPVEFETTTRPATDWPLSAADGLPVDLGSAVMSAREDLRLGSPAEKTAYVEQAAKAIAPEFEGISLAASDGVEPTSLQWDGLAGHSDAAPLVVEAAADDGRDKVVEQEAIVTLPASADLELEVLADAFSAEPFDPVVPQALELTNDTAGPDTLIAELQASGFADLKLEPPTFGDVPILEAAAPASPATAADMDAERPLHLEEEPSGAAEVNAAGSELALLPVAFEDGLAAAVPLGIAFAGHAQVESDLEIRAARPGTRADVETEEEQIEKRLKEAAIDLPPAREVMDVLELAPAFEAPAAVLPATSALPVLELVPGVVGSVLPESSATAALVPSGAHGDAPAFVAMPIPLVNDIGRPRDRETQAVLAALTRFSRQAHARRLELDARSVA